VRQLHSLTDSHGASTLRQAEEGEEEGDGDEAMEEEAEGEGDPDANDPIVRAAAELEHEVEYWTDFLKVWPRCAPGAPLSIRGEGRKLSTDSSSLDHCKLANVRGVVSEHENTMEGGALEPVGNSRGEILSKSWEKVASPKEL
jgi:hypothetical protein